MSHWSVPKIGDIAPIKLNNFDTVGKNDKHKIIFGAGKRTQSQQQTTKSLVERETSPKLTFGQVRPKQDSKYSPELSRVFDRQKILIDKTENYCNQSFDQLFDRHGILLDSGDRQLDSRSDGSMSERSQMVIENLKNSTTTNPQMVTKSCKKSTTESCQMVTENCEVFTTEIVNESSQNIKSESPQVLTENCQNTKIDERQRLTNSPKNITTERHQMATQNRQNSRIEDTQMVAENHKNTRIVECQRIIQNHQKSSHKLQRTCQESSQGQQVNKNSPEKEEIKYSGEGTEQFKENDRQGSPRGRAVNRHVVKGNEVTSSVNFRSSCQISLDVQTRNKEMWQTNFNKVPNKQIQRSQSARIPTMDKVKKDRQRILINQSDGLSETNGQDEKESKEEYDLEQAGSSLRNRVLQSNFCRQSAMDWTDLPEKDTSRYSNISVRHSYCSDRYFKALDEPNSFTYFTKVKSSMDQLRNSFGDHHIKSSTEQHIKSSVGQHRKSVDPLRNSSVDEPRNSLVDQLRNSSVDELRKSSVDQLRRQKKSKDNLCTQSLDISKGSSRVLIKHSDQVANFKDGSTKVNSSLDNLRKSGLLEDFYCRQSLDSLSRQCLDTNTDRHDVLIENSCDTPLLDIHHNLGCIAATAKDSIEDNPRMIEGHKALRRQDNFQPAGRKDHPSVSPSSKASRQVVANCGTIQELDFPSMVPSSGTPRPVPIQYHSCFNRHSKQGKLEYENDDVIIEFSDDGDSLDRSKDSLDLQLDNLEGDGGRRHTEDTHRHFANISRTEQEAPRNKIDSSKDCFAIQTENLEAGSDDATDPGIHARQQPDTPRYLIDSDRHDADTARHYIDIKRHLGNPAGLNDRRQGKDTARHKEETARQEKDTTRPYVDTARHHKDSARHEENYARQESTRYKDTARHEVDITGPEVDTAKHKLDTGRQESIDNSVCEDIEQYDRQVSINNNDIEKVQFCLEVIQQCTGQVQAFLADTDNVLSALDSCHGDEKCLMLIKRPKHSAKQMLKAHSWANLSVSDTHLNRPLDGGGFTTTGTSSKYPKFKWRRKPDQKSGMSENDIIQDIRDGFNKENSRRYNNRPSPRAVVPPMVSGTQSLDRQTANRPDSNQSKAAEINNNKFTNNRDVYMYHSCLDISTMPTVHETEAEASARLHDNQAYRGPVVKPTEEVDVSRAQSLGDLSQGQNLALSVAPERKSGSMMNLSNVPPPRTKRRNRAPNNHERYNTLEVFQEIPEHYSHKMNLSNSSDYSNSASKHVDDIPREMSPSKQKRSLPHVPTVEANERIKRFTEMMKARMAGQSRNSYRTQSENSYYSDNGRNVSHTTDTPSDNEVSELLHPISPIKCSPRNTKCNNTIQKKTHDSGKGNSYNSRHIANSQPQQNGYMQTALSPGDRSHDSGQITLLSHCSTVDSGYTTNNDCDYEFGQSNRGIPPKLPPNCYPTYSSPKKSYADYAVVKSPSHRTPVISGNYRKENHEKAKPTTAPKPMRIETLPNQHRPNDLKNYPHQRRSWDPSMPLDNDHQPPYPLVINGYNHPETEINGNHGYSTLPVRWKQPNSPDPVKTSPTLASPISKYPTMFQLAQSYIFFPVKVSLPSMTLLLESVEFKDALIELPEGCSSDNSSPLSQGRHTKLGGPGSAFRPVRPASITPPVGHMVAICKLTEDIRRACIMGELKEGDVLIEISGQPLLGADVRIVKKNLELCQGDVTLTVARAKLPITSANEQTSYDTLSNKLAELEKEMNKMKVEMKNKDSKIRQLTAMIPPQRNSSPISDVGIPNFDNIVISDDEFIV